MMLPIRPLLALTALVSLGTILQAASPPITAAAFAPDGKTVVIGSQEGIEILSWPELKPQRRLKTNLDHVHDLAFSPDGKTFLAAGGTPAEEGTVEVWDWIKGTRTRSVSEHADVIHRVAWRADGKQWVTASADGTCRVYDVNDPKSRVPFKGHSRGVTAVGYLPDGKTIISCGIDQTIQVWNATTAKLIRTLDNHVATVNDLALRPSADADALPVVVSASDDRTIRLWQPTIGRLMRFKRLPSRVRVVTWTPDGTHILAGCDDGRLRIFDSDTLDVVQETAVFKSWIYVLLCDRKGDRYLLGGEKKEVQLVRKAK